MSNDHAYELRELMLNWLKSMDTLGERARESLASFTPPPAEPTDEPDRFEYMDDDGDTLSVRPQRPDSPEWLIIGCQGRDGEDAAQVRLLTENVNRLARYLDRHRTDLTDQREPDAPAEHWCGRNSDHPAHLYGNGDTELTCSGSREGVYGA